MMHSAFMNQLVLNSVNFPPASLGLDWSAKKKLRSSKRAVGFERRVLLKKKSPK